MIDNKFFDWLSGLIDGDGCFLLSQKDYGSLEITMDIRDSFCLYRIKNQYGGSIKLRSHSKSIRYRLHHKAGLIQLLNDVNGRIRHSTRLLQFSKLCFKYNIELKPIKELSFDDNWMAGFFDADGTISINSLNYQLSISISQKTQELLIPLKLLYGGYIYIDRNSNTFKWYVTQSNLILYLNNNYFKKSLLYSKKKQRLLLIEQYYDLMLLKNQNNILFEKSWVIFFKKWKLYGYEEDKDMYQFNEN